MSPAAGPGRQALEQPLPMPSLSARLASLVHLGRPTFLLGGIALHALGALLAQRMGYGFELLPFLWGQLTVSAIQLMAQYSNDYFDLEADRANQHPTPWSGGSRVLVRGEVPPSWGLTAALVCAAVAVAAGCMLVMQLRHGVALSASMLVAMFALSWWYSSPPLRLHSRGLGEVAVPLVVPCLTTLSAFAIQAGRLHELAVLFTVPLMLLQLSMLLTLQIPDHEGDRAVGKRTWTVLFGVRPMVALSTSLVIVAFFAGVGSPVFGAPPSVALLWAMLAPLVLFQLWTYWRGDFAEPRRLNRMTFAATAVFFLAIVADLIGLYLAGTPPGLSWGGGWPSLQ